MTYRLTGTIGVALAITFAGCGSETAPAAKAPAAADAADAGKAKAPEAEKPAVPAPDPLSTARGSLEHQFELLKAQKVDELRACFTDRQKERITAKAVAGAQKDVGGMTMDDLWASATEGEFQGKKTMKVKMKNGRTLTTLILTDGKWLADTVWFR